MTYPDNIEQKIDFQVIRTNLHQHCLSSLGQERVDAMHWLTDYHTIQDLLLQVREMTDIYSDASISFPQGEIYDLRESLSRIRIEGLFLDEAELFSLRKTLDYVVELERFFHNLDTIRFPILSRWTAGDDGNLTHIVLSVDRILDRYGQMKDSASPELARIRHEIVQSQGSVGRVLNAILRQAQSEGILDKDVAPTMREGRLVLPVPPAYKRRIGGIVHDESASGKTVFVEPQQVVETNNHIRELEGAERRERVRILQSITDTIRPCVPDILHASTFLGDVDFLCAKALFSQELKAIVPNITDKPQLHWIEARHPVLWLNFCKQNKVVVPLTLRLQDEQHILVISGPNAGGKSVCLKTVAILQYMLQCGLPVPVNEASEAGVFQQLMLDIGDEQSIDDDLSTYSSHLRNMKYFVRHADTHTLLLIDEFGTGTEPLIGGAIAEAILIQLNQQGAYGVITTHYTNLKHLAERTPGIVNGAMLYDRGQFKPLFQLSIGQAGSSFAIEIARQTGLPESIIRCATDIVGEEHIDYDKQLQDIARDKRYWENKRQNIRQREKHLEERIAYYESEIASLKQKRKDIIDQANQQAADILQQSNATIERTIREIKEAKAEKNATLQARKRVERLKTRVAETDKRVSPAKPVRQDKVLRDLSELKVLAKNPSRLIQESPTTSRTLKTSSIADEMRRRKLSFSRELDIRGLRADEALEATIAYIDDAIMVGAEQVTILHGTGTGALKQTIREYLTQRQKLMQRSGTGTITFHDGDIDRGGAGITIVEL